MMNDIHNVPRVSVASGNKDRIPAGATVTQESLFDGIRFKLDLMMWMSGVSLGLLIATLVKLFQQ